MERNGKTLKNLQDGHPRRLSDMRNAWRKASVEQRVAILDWICMEGTVPPEWQLDGLDSEGDRVTGTGSRFHLIEELAPCLLTRAERGWLLMAIRACRKKEQRSAERFPEGVDPKSSLAHRLRVGESAHEKIKAMDAHDDDLPQGE